MLLFLIIYRRNQQQKTEENCAFMKMVDSHHQNLIDKQVFI